MTQSRSNIQKLPTKEKPEVINLKKAKVPKIDGYDFILIGGSIHMGKVQKSIKKFINNNKSILKKKRMGLFISCGYHENSDDYFNVILGESLYKHATVKADIGYAYYLEKMNTVYRKMIIEFAKIDESVESFNLDEIKMITNYING